MPLNGASEEASTPLSPGRLACRLAQSPSSPAVPRPSLDVLPVTDNVVSTIGVVPGPGPAS